MAKTYKTPGIYISEKNSFPNAIVPLATAIPAFIGYTERAFFQRKSYENVPVRISSFAEYETYFGGAPLNRFHLKSDAQGISMAEGQRFLLYYSIKCFFSNGGVTCYIVSVGTYADQIQLSKLDGEQIVNGVSKYWGLRTLLKVPEPTMVAIPEAVCLSAADCYTLQRALLKHCGEISRNRFAILDVHDGFKRRSFDEHDIIRNFREGVGTENLSWGAAYYPWLHSEVVKMEDLNCNTIHPDSNSLLISLLNQEADGKEQTNTASKEHLQKMRELIALINIYNASLKSSKSSIQTQQEIKNHHKTLLQLSATYAKIFRMILEQINLLPPSAAVAGVYAKIDNQLGVHKAPANANILSARKPTVDINKNEQSDLNTPPDGKAINAIRLFPDKGILIWGARTLAGNDNEWRYINVRRTMIFIEQSIIKSLESFVFEPNVENTWNAARMITENFLHVLWSQGALVGSRPQEAYGVAIGLGRTITSGDISSGLMRLHVMAAMLRPAEFIVLEIKIQMQSS